MTTSRLIRDITSHILNAPDRATAAGKGIRILAKMHARKDREPMTTKYLNRLSDVSIQEHIRRAETLQELADQHCTRTIGYCHGKHGEPVAAVCYEGGGMTGGPTIQSGAGWHVRINQGSLRQKDEQNAEQIAESVRDELNRWKDTRLVG